jgi:hypothetical protein
MPIQFEQHVKSDSAKSPNAFIECVRTDGGFKFDELAITKVEFAPVGAQFFIEYERRGKRLKDLPPVTVTPALFAAARAASRDAAGKLDLSLFAKTPLVTMLFADGARQWHEQNKIVEEDFAADMEFLEEMAKARQ